MVAKINADTSNGVIITSDNSGELELQANGVTKAKVTANGLQDANGNSLRGGSFRNLIINGDMRIAQRGTSAAGITMFGYLTVDRWKHDNYNAGTWTYSQDTDVPTGQGFSNSLKMTCIYEQSPLPSDARLQQGYRIEGQHLQHLKYGSSNAESLTLSFWVKTNKTGTYVINLYDLDNSKNIGSQYTVSSADTWEKKTLTFSGNTLNNFDNDNNASLLIEFWFGAGFDKTTGTPPTTWTAIDQTTRAGGITVNLADTPNNYANITGVQLEVGEGASDFEFLPYDVQLARCQRYYQKITGMTGYTAGTLTSIQCSVNYPVEMRATPDLSQSGVFRFDDGSTGFTQSATNIAYQGFQNNRGTIVGFGNFAFNGYYRPHGKANTATLNLSAEL